MDKTKILTLVEKFYDNEYNDLKNHFERVVNYTSDSAETKSRAITYAVQRCLGIALFVQGLGVTYEEINPIYNEIQDKIYGLA